MSNPFDAIAALGVVPVIAIDRADDAVALADALIEGGLPVAEITFRTPAAAAVMERISAERPQLLVGAGTVLDLDSLEAARRSGARFGLAPGFDAEIVAAAGRHGFPFAPGVMTPSEVSAAAARGIGTMKFFPAGAAGGPKALDAIAAPFRHLGLRFIPTGGVNLQTAKDFIKAGAAALGVGADLVDLQALRRGEAETITERARKFLSLVAEARAE